jgi:UDP-N-acetylmuramoylalanine-D-glutamate ligase
MAWRTHGQKKWVACHAKDYVKSKVNRWISKNGGTSDRCCTPEIEFDSIAPLVRERVLVAILIGEMKERIAASWSGVDCRISSSLEEAVAEARKVARHGDAVLFSPGTSSFDMFRNYGERGNRFKDAVNALK